MRFTPRVLTVASALVVGGTVAATPTTAFAHSHLRSTSPAAHASVAEPMTEVTLTFDEPVKQTFSTIVVTGPDNVSYSRGDVRVVDSTAHQPVYPLRSGGYTVTWRVVSADGHPVTGSFAFTVNLPASLEPTRSPAEPTPVASATPGPDGSWWWLTGAIAVVVASVLALVARRRRTR